MKHRSWLDPAVRLFVACVGALGVVGLFAPMEPAHGQSQWSAERGLLPRGTTYEMRKPNQWNGTLINDLDFAQTPDAPRYLWLLNHGYAVSGTARRADRNTNYDPAHEIVDLINVLDLFAAKFGKPTRTIEYGQSGGGHDALAMAELHPDRLDGVVAACAHTNPWLMNSELDAWFTLKTLIAPDLQIADLPSDLTTLTPAWRDALAAAQKTPIGRARIALATTVGQLPAWVSSTTPEPDPADVVALENSMYESFVAGASQVAGQSRFMSEHAAPGQPSWNDDVNYAQFFSRGDAAYQKAARKLYQTAGVTLEADLAKLTAAKRIPPDPKAIKWWSAPGRTVLGDPKVPVLRIHTNGDPAVPVSLVAGYDAAVKAHGHQALYRTAFVRGPGHCTFTVAEVAAAIDTVMRRLDSGNWGDTSPQAMNQLGAKLDSTSAARFYKYEQFPYNRGWLPTLDDYLGRHGVNGHGHP